jgi:hypothetical protein
MKSALYQSLQVAFRVVFLSFTFILHLLKVLVYFAVGEIDIVQIHE